MYKRTPEELGNGLATYFTGVKEGVTKIKSNGYVTIGNPSNGAVACMRLLKNIDNDLVCESVRVFATTSHDGSFGECIPSDEIPMSEQRWLMNQHFNTRAEAYSLVLDRVIEINDFFKH